MVKSCDSAWPRPRRSRASYVATVLARTAVRWIDHGYEGARLEER